jgi:hypothetical protein
MVNERQTQTAATKDGLHCVYGTCRGIPRSPNPCHPGCYFQMSAISELELLRRSIKDVIDAG